MVNCDMETIGAAKTVEDKDADKTTDGRFV